MSGTDILTLQAAALLSWFTDMIPVGMLIGAGLFVLYKCWWLVMYLVNGGGLHRSDW